MKSTTRVFACHEKKMASLSIDNCLEVIKSSSMEEKGLSRQNLFRIIAAYQRVGTPKSLAREEVLRNEKVKKILSSFSHGVVRHYIVSLTTLSCFSAHGLQEMDIYYLSQLGRELDKAMSNNSQFPEKNLKLFLGGLSFYDKTYSHGFNDSMYPFLNRA